jgi:hypothetical protein
MNKTTKHKPQGRMLAPATHASARGALPALLLAQQMHNALCHFFVSGVELADTDDFCDWAYATAERTHFRRRDDEIRKHLEHLSQ